MNLAAHSEPIRRTVDWQAAIWAGLAAGLVSGLMYLYFVPYAVGAGNAAVVSRYLASVMLGVGVLPPPATIDPGIALAAVTVHFALSLIMAAIIAFVLHRWGLLTGILGGGAMGLMFFAINYYTLTINLPHFFAMAHWSVALVHLVFGAFAGGVYELLEKDPPVVKVSTVRVA